MKTKRKSKNADLEFYIAKDGRPKYILAAAAGMAPSKLSRIVNQGIAVSKKEATRLAKTLKTHAEVLNLKVV